MTASAPRPSWPTVADRLVTALNLAVGYIFLAGIAYQHLFAVISNHPVLMVAVFLIGGLLVVLVNRGWRELGFIAYAYLLLLIVSIVTYGSFAFAVVYCFCGGVIAFVTARMTLSILRTILIASFFTGTRHPQKFRKSGLEIGSSHRRFSFLSRGECVWGLLLAFSFMALAIINQSLNLSPWHFVIICLLLTGFAWLRLNRHAYELWVESWARFMYKIRGHGPKLPLRGPLLIIANHSCWWDPLFLAGVLDRPITPMMTASFYDIWHLKPLMKYVIGAIRVPEKAMRHEAPEIQEAIAALNRGECVVIFPEGYLRRKEEVPLRRFGRGVWEILKSAPNTPVVAAWIEGGWGSWCSWKDGPPTKNKKFDIRRRIDVSLSSPFTVPADLLENHWKTRMYLMNCVSASMVPLGLAPLPEFKSVASDEPDEGAP